LSRIGWASHFLGDPCVRPSPILPSSRPTSLWKGEGRLQLQLRLWSVLRVLGHWWVSPHPSEEGRGSWRGSCALWGRC
jgi:hypothetical protein